MLPGGWEWAVILFVALLVFGSRLPNVMRSMGRSISEFKKGMREGEEELASSTKASKSQEGDEASAGEEQKPAG
jgi:sec-independent protein translocase protein TatA